MKLKIEIEGELHRIVYMDYINGLPHQVTTELIDVNGSHKCLVLYHWDFFPERGERTDLRHYNSGSGGYGKDRGLQAPQWADGYIGTYWLAEDMTFEGAPINAKRVKHPKVIEGWCGEKSTNPFKISWLTHSREFCDRCGHESTEYCKEHIYEDEEGDLRYSDDDSIVE